MIWTFMPLLLRSVYWNTGRLRPANLSNATPKNTLLMLRPDAAGLALDAWAWVAVTAPPMANATMAARPMATSRRRRLCLPISRMMRSLREQVPNQIVSVNTDEVTLQGTKSCGESCGIWLAAAYGRG